jgi:hypothetical protein
MRVFQLLELPELLEADALYFILNGDYAESYLTDDNGVAKFIGNTSMIESLAAGGSTTVAELTDATTYDFPTLNTAVSDALAGKAPKADPTFTGTVSSAAITASGTVTVGGSLTVDGAVTLSPVGQEVVINPSASVRIQGHQFYDNNNVSTSGQWSFGQIVGFANGNNSLGIGATGGVTFGEGLIKFAGATSSFPAIKRNGTAINIRLADDSGDAAITASNLTASGTVTGTTGTFSGALSGAAGSISAPSIYLGGDTGTGFWRSSANNWTFTHSSVNRLVIALNGIFLKSNNTVGWSSFDPAINVADVQLSRLSAGQLQVGTTGTNALGSLSLANLTASGTVEAAAYTLGGVAQQDVSTGASPTFAGQTLTATQTVAVSGTVPVIYQGGSQAFNQFKTGATTRGYMGWTSLGGGGMCFLNASGAAATLLVSDTGNLTASGTVTSSGIVQIRINATTGQRYLSFVNANNTQEYFSFDSGPGNSPVVNMQSSQNLLFHAGVFEAAKISRVGDLTVSGTVKTGSYTVATLPLTPSTGMRAQVTDSSVAAHGHFGATVAAGGANTVPVFYDGTNWIIA